jgi:hypothetical protein
MRLEGGCYCGTVRYVAESEPVLRAQCHCRACQYISGGAPNLFMLMPAEGFAYTKGAPKSYTRPDKADAVTREFCGECGTHMITRRPGLPPVVLKIGTLDDPSVYGGAHMAIFTAEGQPFHLIADGVPALNACRRASNPNRSRRWHWREVPKNQSSSASSCAVEREWRALRGCFKSSIFP